jgi:hypothetical protein
LEARNLLDVNSLAPMPAPWVQVFHGDFNGDGKQDVAGIDSSGQWWVSLSTGTSFSPRTKWAQWSIPAAWTKLFVADVDGDGKDDIVGFGYNGAWFVGLSNGTNAFTTGSAWAQWSIPASWDQVFVGDFNGDHKADIAGMGNNGAWFVGLSNGTDTYATEAAWAHWSIGASWSQLFVGDFNGDGKEDVAGFGVNGTWFVGQCNGADTLNTGAAWAHWSSPASWSQLFVADFNGDGKADIAGAGVNGAVFVGLSNGVDTFTTGAAWDQIGPTSIYAQFFVADVNGDGKADLLTFSHYENIFGVRGDAGQWTVAFSNGTNSFPTGTVALFWDPPNSIAQLFVADFNGDGKADLAVFDLTDARGNPNPTMTPTWFVGPTFIDSLNNISLGSQTLWARW